MQVTSSSLGIQLKGANWESVKEIAVDREGTCVYKLRPQMDNVPHQIVCEVALYDAVKVVTFRSSFRVQNTTGVPLEVAVMDARGQIMGKIHQMGK
jgi:vacuolar protein sorting-associated protein 13A/C